MDSKEYAEIESSTQAIVRRAYDLGRSEALKRVVEVLSTERSSAEQLALMAPDQTTSPVHEEGSHEALASNGAGPTNGTEEAHSAASFNGTGSSEKKPWWAWPIK